MPRTFTLLSLCGFLFVSVTAGPVRGQQELPPDDLASVLEPLRAEAHAPALAAAVMTDQRIVEIGAVGVCKLGESEEVKPSYRFHLGSDTKAITATLAALLVEDGVIEWQTTVGQAFPQEKGLDPVCATITLEQLLNHRAGLPQDPGFEYPYRDFAWQEATSGSDQRLFLLREMLAHSPKTTPGEKYAYSNVGYAVAGAMMESCAHQSWEDLLRTRLFGPLGMEKAGFGYPARVNGKVFGHYRDKDGKLIPAEPGPGDDDPAALGPAGTVHCTLEDWAKFAIFHLRGSHEDTPLLKKSSFDKLHTPPPGQDYAMGWLALPRAWAGGTTLSHAGSNGKFLAIAWLAPEKKMAILVTTNSSGEEAESLCSKTIVTLLQHNRPMLAKHEE